MIINQESRSTSPNFNKFMNNSTATSTRFGNGFVDNNNPSSTYKEEPDNVMGLRKIKNTGYYRPNPDTDVKERMSVLEFAKYYKNKGEESPVQQQQ